jgi:hypothetical protein
VGCVCGRHVAWAADALTPSKIAGTGVVLLPNTCDSNKRVARITAFWFSLRCAHSTACDSGLQVHCMGLVCRQAAQQLLEQHIKLAAAHIMTCRGINHTRCCTQHDVQRQQDRTHSPGAVGSCCLCSCLQRAAASTAPSATAVG